MRTIYFVAAAAVVVGDCGVNYCCLIANFFLFFFICFLNAGYLYIHSAVDTTTVLQYNAYWGSSSTQKIGSPDLSLNIAVSSEAIIILSLNSMSIPNGATHVLVYTQNGAGEMLTGISTRILDSIEHGLYIIPEFVSSEIAWLEASVNAVVCRVSIGDNSVDENVVVSHADMKMGYTGMSNDIDPLGGRVANIYTTNVQYSYFATAEYKLALGSSVNMNVRFNKEKYISCQPAA